ncbi:MAG: hypothetical protein NTY39_11340 [Campylobacterales bacterium]|nr:hypothetical protein [Campylobacterales bacterium]
MQTNNEIEVISRDAVLLSAINGLSGYMFGNDKELWQKLTAMRLSIIIPDSIENDQDGWVALYAFIIANITENIEIEAKILELFQSDEMSRNNLLKINYSSVKHTDNFMEEITPILVNCLHGAGVENVRKAFEELDLIGLEHGVNGLDEVKIREAVNNG